MVWLVTTHIRRYARPRKSRLRWPLTFCEGQSGALVRCRIPVAACAATVRKVPRDVHAALAALAGYLGSKGADVSYLHLPDGGEGKTGLDDYLAAEGAGGIWELVRPDPPPLAQSSRSGAVQGGSNISGQVPEKPVPDVPPMTIT
jgi:hypothetical protein